MKTRILYEDKNILVCYKPAGLAAQTAKVGQQDMVSELKNYLAKQSRAENGEGKGMKSPYLGVIHRLDQPVEGLLVFAKDSRCAGGLTEQLINGMLNKQYYAVICGQPGKNYDELVDYLSKDPETGSVVVTDSPKTGKKAVLQYRIIGQISTPEPLALADIHIDTGRFHQIRAQLAHAGMPLIGDSRYGNELSKRLSAQMNVRNVALCAYSIAFRHPVTGKNMEFKEKPEGKIFSLFV